MDLVWFSYVPENKMHEIIGTPGFPSNSSISSARFLSAHLGEDMDPMDPMDPKDPALLVKAMAETLCNGKYMENIWVCLKMLGIFPMK